MKKFNMRKLVLACADMLIISMASLITNYLLDILDLTTLPAGLMGIYTFCYIVVSFFSLYLFGAYKKMWRYFRPRDYISCIAGIAVSTIALFGVSIAFSISYEYPVNYHFLIITPIISVIGIVLFRLIFRKTFLKLINVGKDEVRKRILIVGGGQACRMIIREITSDQNDPESPSNQYRAVCIVDDDRTKIKSDIYGVPVMGVTEEIPRLCKEWRVDEIFFAIPSCTEEERRRILDICSETQCPIKVIPYISQLLFDDDNAGGIVHQMKDIKIEDLLGREPITFDKEDIKNFIKGKVCMITGGGGSIGSELTRQIAKYEPKQIIIVDIYENNAYDIQQELLMEYEDLNLKTLIASVRDYNKMKIIFEKYRPQLVFHAAAHKHVPLMETSPEEAVKNNIIGTFNVATLSEFYDVQKFIMISTDKAVNPTNVMGATKRCCEMIIQYMVQYNPKTEFITTRFGNVLGSNGSVIPLFKRQIESGKPVTVTHPDIIRYFMTIPEAVSLVLQAAAMAHGGEIFVLDMGAPVKITTLAENLIRMYGKVPYKDVEIKFTGLRPGEKLFEELLMDEEGLKSTANKKIFIGNQIEINPDEFINKMTRLKRCAMANDSEKTIEALSEIVPTFVHKENKPKNAS